MKLDTKKTSFFLPVKICSNENCIVSTSDVTQQLYNAWDAPKQMNCITKWVCPSFKDRLLEEYCKVILINRVRGWLVLITLKYQYE